MAMFACNQRTRDRGSTGQNCIELRCVWRDDVQGREKTHFALKSWPRLLLTRRYNLAHETAWIRDF